MICYRLIDENTAHHDVSPMARLPGVSRQGYYAWRDRAPSRRRREDAELTEKIRRHHERSHGTYGAPRIHADLREIDGLSVGRKRVARLMRKAGLTGVHRRTGRVSLTRQDRQATAAPDLIGRDFTASAPNLRWTADITYVPTDQGLALPRRDHGPVLPPYRRLGDGRPHENRAGHRRPRHGGHGLAQQQAPQDARLEDAGRSPR